MSGDPVITPQHVEQRLINLSKELDAASVELDTCEVRFAAAKTAWEVNSAKTRIAIRGRHIDAGRKFTVSDVDDEAMVRCQDEQQALNHAEALVRSARGNVSRIKTQIDITRSVGTSVRAAMELA
jgi:hypothetical protein